MILTNSFLPDVRVYKEAKYLITLGFDVEILCWDRENEYLGREDEMIDGIKIKRFFPYSKYGTGFKQFFAYIRFINNCRSYLQKKEYDFLHCHDLDGIIVGSINKKKSAKLIFDMHEFYEGKVNKKIIKLFIRYLTNMMQNRSNWLIFVNRTQIESVHVKNKNKLIELPNYPEYKSLGELNKNVSDHLRISYIGSVRQFNELKNLMIASKDIERIKVLIHGTGNAYKRLKKIEREYKKSSITGKYHFSKIPELYQNTDILYCVFDMSNINWKTGFSVKFYEAIITKTPIIVSKGSAMEEFVIQKDIGFVVDGSNVNEIRILLNKININKELLEKKIKNLEKCHHDYKWEDVVTNLNRIYKI